MQEFLNYSRQAGLMFMFLPKEKYLKSGDSSLAGKLEEKGYDWVLEKKSD